MAAEFRRYLRAARKAHGEPGTLVETAAAQGFPAPDLARLVDTIRDRNPGWRLPKAQRDPLVDGLLEAGWDPTKISRKLGCSRSTVYSRAENHAATSQPPPVHGLYKRPKCPENEGCDCPPVLAFSAAGTLSEPHLEIRRVLGLDR